MHENSRPQYVEQKLQTSDVTEEWYDDLRERFTMGKSLFGAPHRIDVTLTIDNGGPETLEGTFLTLKANSPNIRLSDGRHCFIAVEDDGEDSRVLFERSWENKTVPRYKYRIDEIELKAYHFETPNCPKCDTSMDFGMPQDENAKHSSSWICPDCFSGRYEKGIK